MICCSTPISCLLYPFYSQKSLDLIKQVQAEVAHAVHLESLVLNYPTECTSPMRHDMGLLPNKMKPLTPGRDRNQVKSSTDEQLRVKTHLAQIHPMT